MMKQVDTDTRANPGTEDADPSAGVGRVPNPGKPLAGIRLLLVEDEPVMREVMVWVFEVAGAKVVDVDNAAAARTALRGHATDVIVSDVGLPGEDGYSLIRSIRRDAAESGARNIPALALTAYVEDRNLAVAAGFDAFNSKPIGPDELVHAVATLIGRQNGN